MPKIKKRVKNGGNGEKKVERLRKIIFPLRFVAKNRQKQREKSQKINKNGKK